MAKRKRKKNPTLRWVAAVLAAAGAFQLGVFFANFVGGLLAAALAFYVEVASPPLKPPFVRPCRSPFRSM